MESFLDQLVATSDGSLTLRHPVYDEEFHAREGARFETHELYMQASGFLSVLEEGGHDEALGVLDVGLGLGYNALMTIESWWKSPGNRPVYLLSLEISPELVVALSDSSCPWKKGWSELWNLFSESLEKDGSDWRALFVHPLSGRSLSWSVCIGDAALFTLPKQHFDFVWQDAFSPGKNPELWTVHWFRKVKEASKAGAKLMTYSVARIVKDHLTEGGWDYQKFKAPGTKKQWLRASFS
jgi:tRNA U34 5-methylaminomethyl-2-thiouridine-forming methyltransferase MnmC